MSMLLYALLDALPFGIGGAVIVYAAATAAGLSPLFVTALAGLGIYAGAVGLSLYLSGETAFPLLREALPGIVLP
ncbi:MULTISPECIES: hypothetical protein [Haloarcula]|uniref:hypothetical protein n=1 Tax=Haloarcula TaxID=2237 RepID=UPI0023E8CC1A|nr:hypothetical protein [Halomicroarcula sp. SHR3]